MNRFIKKYFLPNFIILFIVFCLVVFTGKKETQPAQDLGFAFALAFGLALIIGGIYYFLQNWLTKHATAMMSKPPFTHLKQNGFRDEGDFVWGTVNGYTVFVAFSLQRDRSAIDVDVLFNPKSLGKYLDRKQLQELTDRHKKYSWDRNITGCSLKYIFKPASYEKVIATAETMIEILKKENLKPVGKQESAAQLPELRKWIKANDL